VSGEYWTVSVTLPPGAEAAAEAVANFLWEAGAVGVVESEPGSGLAAALGPRTVQAFFPPGSDPDGLDSGMTRYLQDLEHLGMPIGSPRVVAGPLADAPWADAWRAHFRPVPVGRGLLVCPPWDVPAPGPGASALADRRAVVIEPGRAFGTGGHATTQGCLELLERALAGRTVPARVVDAGTGSGVLAIAAALLGVPRVDAFDLDPDAVAATEANAARNGVAGQVHAVAGDLLAWPGPPAPLALANLLGATHVAHAGAVGRLVSPTGRLIAGGLLAHETPAVVGAFVSEGFRLGEVTEREGWATLLLTREPT
jgi:ribosomal protein L11 methyltransferase